MHPISFVCASLSKQLDQRVMKSSLATIMSKPVYFKFIGFKPSLAMGLLGLCVFSMDAQAAVTSVGDASPTSSLQLISLNADDIATEDDIDMLETADESDDEFLLSFLYIFGRLIFVDDV